MPLLVIPALLIGLLCLGIGLAVGLCLLAVTAVLVATGIVSSSVVMGLITRRLSVGLRTLLLQLGVLGGVVGGIGIAWLGQAFLSNLGLTGQMIAYAALGGGLGGAVIALTASHLATRLQGAVQVRVSSVMDRARPRPSGDAVLGNGKVIDIE
jgi:hypothetical protein